MTIAVDLGRKAMISNETKKQTLKFCLNLSDINWTWVDDETKDRLGMQSKDDGEFWMSYKDFCRHFSEVTICLMGPDFDGDGVSDSAGMKY